MTKEQALQLATALSEDISDAIDDRSVSMEDLLALQASINRGTAAIEDAFRRKTGRGLDDVVH